MSPTYLWERLVETVNAVWNFVKKILTGRLTK